MNMEMINMFGALVMLLAALVMLVYWGMRSIDSHYKTKEKRQEYDHDAYMMRETYSRQMDMNCKLEDRKFTHRKAIMQSQYDRNRNMQMDLIKQINDNWFKELSK